MTDLELDVWDAWLRERQEHLEETLSNISPSEEPCRYYLLTGYIQGMLEALTMLTTVEDGKRFKIKLEQFRQNLLLSGDYDATGNYKQAVKKTAVLNTSSRPIGRLFLCPKTVAYTTYRFYVVRFFRIFFYFLSQILD